MTKKMNVFLQVLSSFLLVLLVIGTFSTYSEAKKRNDVMDYTKKIEVMIDGKKEKLFSNDPYAKRLNIETLRALRDMNAKDCTCKTDVSVPSTHFTILSNSTYSLELSDGISIDIDKVTYFEKDKKLYLLVNDTMLFTSEFESMKNVSEAFSEFYLKKV